MNWFRMYSEILDDPKIRRLRDSRKKWIFVGLLCMASESKIRGKILIDEDIPYTTEEIAERLQVDTEFFEQTLQELQQLKMIEVQDSGVIVISNWHKRQFSSDNSTKRVKRYREKKKQEKCDVTETLQQRFENVSETPPDTESESDTETESTPPISPPKGGGSPKYFSGPEDLEPVFDKFTRYSGSDKSVIRDYWALIRFTRKSARIAMSKIITEMEYWERFPVDIVTQALTIHMRKYQAKQEEYTRGIMRRLKKEKELGGMVNGTTKASRASPKNGYGAEEYSEFVLR